MQAWNAVAVFCEDIREETRNLNSLMGVFPDNMNVPKIPGAFSKIGFYARVHVNAKADVGAISVYLRLPDGHEDSLQTVAADLVKKEQKKSRENQRPNAGFIVQGILNGLPITQEGQLQLIVRVGDEETVAGVLALKLDQSVRDSTASQSPNAVPKP